MAELKCSDGTVVQISAKTEAELRKAFESGHVWEHGDVFKNITGINIYLKPYGGPIVVNLSHVNGGGTPEIQLPGSTFLYNIKDRIDVQI